MLVTHFTFWCFHSFKFVWSTEGLVNGLHHKLHVTYLLLQSHNITVIRNCLLKLHVLDRLAFLEQEGDVMQTLYASGSWYGP